MSDPSELRIILIGKTGVGKSAVGNTILNMNRFPTGSGSSSVTRRCQKESAVIAGRTVTIVDTPDFFHSTHEEHLYSEIDRSVELSSPGAHAFLYVLKPTTFTTQEAETVSKFKETFGEEVLRHTVVLFTQGDRLQRVVMNTLISQNQELMSFVTDCGGRFTVLNNEIPVDRQQVYYLLNIIDRMVSANQNSLYTLEMRRKQNKAKYSAMFQYICVIAFFSLIMGCMFSRGSAVRFVHGCGLGGSATALGVISRKLLVLRWGNLLKISASSPQQCPTAFYANLKRAFGVLSGGLVGSLVGSVFSDQPPVLLLAALAGAAGSYIAMHREC